MIDYSKIYQLKVLQPKSKGHTNFYDCCDLTREGGSDKRWHCFISLFSKMGDQGEHSALKVSEYRTPQNPRTFRSSSQNLLSGQLKFIVKLLPCHAMANLQHNGKKWYCKKWNFWKNQLKGFFFFQIYHPKLMSQKYNFEFFYDSALLIDPIMRLKFSFFSCPEFKFLRGS